MHIKFLFYFLGKYTFIGTWKSWFKFRTLRIPHCTHCIMERLTSSPYSLTPLCSHRNFGPIDLSPCGEGPEWGLLKPCPDRRIALCSIIFRHLIFQLLNDISFQFLVIWYNCIMMNILEHVN
mgnify:CR=1 FL=1